MDKIKEIVKKAQKNINANNWEKKFVVLSLFFAILVFFLGRTYEDYIKENSSREIEMEESYSNDTGSVHLLNRRGVTQSIKGTYNGLSAVAVIFSTSDARGDEKIYVDLKKANNEVVHSWESISRDVKNGEWTKYELTEDITDSADCTFNLSIRSEGNVGIFVSNEDIYSKGECEGVVKENKEQDLFFATYGSSYDFIKPMYFIIGIGGIIFALLMCFYILFARKIKLEYVFLCTCLGLGILYMIVFPPFTVPDESAHFVSSFHLSEEIMGEPEYPLEKQSNQDVFDNDGILNRATNMKVYRRVYNGFGTSSDEYINFYRGQYDYIGQGKNLRFGYYIQALAIVLARKLDLGYIPTVYIARLFNLLMYALITFWAIKIMPKFKLFMTLVALLPISIEVSASLSYDGWINSFSFLFIAYCLHLIFVKEKIKLRDTILLATILILCAHIKAIYYPLGIMGLLLPKDKIDKKSHHIVVIIILFIMFAFSLGGLMGITGNGEDIRVVEENLTYEEQTYSVEEIISNPINSFNIFMNTLRYQFGTYLDNIVGSPLGSLNIEVNRTILYIIFVIMILALFSQNKELSFNAKQNAVMFAAMTVPIFLSALAMFYCCTAHRYNSIIGIQGRYFIAALPLLPFQIQKVPIKLTANLDKKILTLFLFVQIWLLLDVVGSRMI